MSQPNLFQEVAEDIERQRLEALWKRYSGVVMAAALAIVVGTAAMTAYRSYHAERNQQLTAALIDLSKPESADISKLQGFADGNRGTTQASFALLHAAATAWDKGDKAKAVEIYDSIAKDTSVDTAFRQLADLFAVRAQMDVGDAKALSERLNPLTAEDAPWRYSALEIQAYLALRAGDAVKAKQIFTDLSQDARVSPTISARAADMLRSLN